MPLDLSFIRSQFPAFSEPSLKGWAFFENAGGSYPCTQFLDRLTTFYLRHKVQPYYAYPASIQAGEMMDESYRRFAEALNVDAEEVHFGPSTTQNVYVLARALRPLWQEGDEIVVSCQDHEANAGAWRRLADRGLKVVEWHVNPETGVLDPGDLENLFTDKTRLVAFPHASNIIGHINPVEAICKKARACGVVSVVDGVGYAPHGFPDLKVLGADIYLFSLYKTFGPHLGLMYIRGSLEERMENQAHFFKEGLPRYMFTPAGPDHAQIGSAAGIIDYFDRVYEHHFQEKERTTSVKVNAVNELIRSHENALLEPLMSFLADRDDVKIVGPDTLADRLPIVSLIPSKKDLDSVYATLTDRRIMLGHGHFYAVRPLMDMSIPTDPGVLRLSFVHYTSKEEIDQLIGALEMALD
jgi:cysteine desulfurase family protein (TIGR01976 family)